jgi:hypothetical protein
MDISVVSTHVCSKAEGRSLAPNDFAEVSFLMRCADMFAEGVSIWLTSQSSVGTNP